MKDDDHDFNDYKRLFNETRELHSRADQEILRLEARIRVLEERLEKKGYEAKALKMKVRDLEKRYLNPEKVAA